MAIAFNSLYSELAALVKATWPDIVVAGETRLWEADHIAAIPFEGIAGDGPFAVIVFPSPQQTNDFGEGNRAFLLPCEFWWCAQTAQGSETHRTRGEALASALWTAGRAGLTGAITQGQVWSDPMPAPRWGISLEINQMLATKKAGFLAGGALATVVVGESP